MKDCPRCNKENRNDAEYCSCLYRFGEDETTAFLEETPEKKAIREERRSKFKKFLITALLIPLSAIILNEFFIRTGFDYTALMIAVIYLRWFFLMLLFTWFANILGYSIAVSLLLSSTMLIPYMFWFPFAVLFLKYTSLQKVKPVSPVKEIKKD